LRMFIEYHKGVLFARALKSFTNF